jgi:putative transposase
MSKVPRIVVPGVPHHVTQRGNRRVAVFREEADYVLYLDLLRHYCFKHGVSVDAFCLMPNHVHLVVTPEAEISISRTIRDTHRFYASQFNQKNGYVGHLWQGRFYSCGLDEPHFWAAIRYVERNPVRAGLVRYAEEYRWSSAPIHCRSRPVSGGVPALRPMVPPSASLWTRPGKEWSAWLRDGEDERLTQAIRKETISRRRCG